VLALKQVLGLVLTTALKVRPRLELTETDWSTHCCHSVGLVLVLSMNQRKNSASLQLGRPLKPTPVRSHLAGADLFEPVIQRVQH
jgi:hypothetical protein